MKLSTCFVLCCTLLSACAGPAPVSASFDLGQLPPATPTRLQASWKINDISAPAALDSPQLLYRLSYAQAQQALPYAHSRWSMPPAQLLTQRLKSRMASAGALVAGGNDGLQTRATLRLELEEFVHDFSTPQQSVARLRWRASVSVGRQLLAQRSFVHEQPASSADAAGGTRALAAVSDSAIDALLQWLQQQESRLP